MEPVRREISNGALLIHDRAIEQVGATAELPRQRMKRWICKDGIFSNDYTLACQIQADQAITIQFRASRDSLSTSISQRGLAPDHAVENGAMLNRAVSQLRSPLAVGEML
jgi:hypothetical protein